MIEYVANFRFGKFVLDLLAARPHGEDAGEELLVYPLSPIRVRLGIDQAVCQCPKICWISSQVCHPERLRNHRQPAIGTPPP